MKFREVDSEVFAPNANAKSQQCLTVLIRPNEETAEVAGHIADIDNVVLVGVAGVDRAFHAALGGHRTIGLDIYTVGGSKVGYVADRCLNKNIPTREL